MKIYLAGNASPIRREKRISLFYTRRLLSFFYVSSTPAEIEVFNWIITNAKGKEENID
jgi:hypothetical protein